MLVPSNRCTRRFRANSPMVALRQTYIAKRYKTQAGRITRCTWTTESSAMMITKSIALAPSRGQNGADAFTRTSDTCGANREGGAAGLGGSTAAVEPADNWATGTRFLLRSSKYKLNDPKPASSTILPARKPMTGMQYTIQQTTAPN